MCEVTPPNREQANQETPLEPRPWPGSRRSKPKTRERQDHKKYGSPKPSAIRIQRGVAREQGVEIVARFVDKATQNLLGPLQSQSGTGRVRRQIELAERSSAFGAVPRCLCRTETYAVAGRHASPLRPTTKRRSF
jgi:hypothetical protein